MKRYLSQEALKLLACGLMLLDHIGAVLLPSLGLRLIGRLAFPIFCFLLSEGASHTRNPRRYGLRLLIAMVLSELPFDLLFYGRPSWAHQNVMVTLLLAFLAIQAVDRCKGLWKLTAMVPFVLLAELLRADYGGVGVCMVLLFHLTRQRPKKLMLQLAGLLALNAMLPSAKFYGIPIQLFAAAALVPIGLYSGQKATRSPAIQWGFYLFYPLHLTLLWLIFLYLWIYC